MTRAPGRIPRATALLVGTAYALHQLRYALVPDAASDPAHGYLQAVPVLLVGLAALALARTLVALGHRSGGARPWSVRRAAPASAAALLALHILQEGAEHVFGGGGPLDAGLLLVVPLCAVAGLLVAFALREADSAVARLAGDVPQAPRPVSARVAALVAVVARATRPAPPLARHLAGRAPPALG